jgi:hypothetical protein
MLDRKDLLQDYSERSKSLFEERFNESVSASKMLEAYQKICENSLDF